ncbi:MAG: NusG domain II-containing protein [Oscillospiraceae bacterium]|jgi:hypothetical protein|nr:NusG domain II-containing protein [Oscillospiraceae bacterium]
MKRGDLLLLLCCLALAGALLLPNVLAAKPTQVKINGEAFSLSQTQTVARSGVVVEIAQGRARVRTAPCPDQLCVHTGWLTHSGETAVCLPQRVSVELVGGKTAVDGVAF